MFHFRKKRNFLISFMIFFSIDPLLNSRSYAENSKEQFQESYIIKYKNISKKNYEKFSPAFSESFNKGNIYSESQYLISSNAYKICEKLGWDLDNPSDRKWCRATLYTRYCIWRNDFQKLRDQVSCKLGGKCLCND